MQERFLRALAVAAALVVAAGSSAGCDDGATDGIGGQGGAGATDAELRRAAVASMHATLAKDVQALVDASIALQAAAPTPPDRGWDATLDAAAISTMRAKWIEARTAYERVEGALAPLFPNIDAAIDARYDDFLAELVGTGDPDLFDDQGVTGLHAVERVIFSDVIPVNVVALESTLPGYVAASFPATAAQAASFKAKLCERMVDDAKELLAQWTPANIDASIAFAGLVSLMNEQREKVQKASTGEEESRYSARTMADLRDNLAGTKAAYAAFQPWLLTRSSADPTKDGAKLDAAILAGFASLDAAYAKVSGPSIPTPPATWSAENPTPADLMTPFGQLFVAVSAAVDAEDPASIVSQMNDAALALGLMTF
jgi:iron uptake system component EfeO